MASMAKLVKTGAKVITVGYLATLNPNLVLATNNNGETTCKALRKLPFIPESTTIYGPGSVAISAKLMSYDGYTEYNGLPCSYHRETGWITDSCRVKSDIHGHIKNGKVSFKDDNENPITVFKVTQTKNRDKKLLLVKCFTIKKIPNEKKIVDK